MKENNHPIEEMREALNTLSKNISQDSDAAQRRVVMVNDLERVIEKSSILISYTESLECNIKELESELPNAIECPKCKGRGWYANSVEEFMKGTILCEQCDGNKKVKP